MNWQRHESRSLTASFVSAAFALAACLALAGSSYAANPYGGHIEWKKTGPRSVEFTVIQGYRRSSYTGTALDGRPAIGDVIADTDANPTLAFGDGFRVPLQYRVIAIDPARDWLLGKAFQTGTGSTTPITYTYRTATGPGGAPWFAEVFSCCRANEDVLNRLRSYRLWTYVETASGNTPPSTSFPPVIEIGQGANQSFTIPAADRDPNTRLTFRLGDRLAQPPETGSGFFRQPAGLTVDPNTGVVTWNSSSAAENSLWSVVIVIEDRDAETDEIKTAMDIDFYIRPHACAGNPAPSFEAPSPACLSTVDFPFGSSSSFTVQANDAQPVKLNSGEIPGGSSLGTALPTTGNPVSTSLSWAPTAGELGDVHVVSFVADDGCLSNVCSYALRVVCPPDNAAPAFVAPTPACGEPMTVIVGNTLSFSVQASDGDLANQLTLSSSALPAGATMSPALPRSGSGSVGSTFSWTPTAADAGKHNITFTVTDQCGASSECSYSILVDQAPDCSMAQAIVSTRRPNHQFEPVTIVGVSDPDGDPVTITITGITQDEALDGLDDGSTCPDAQISGGIAYIRSERSGSGDGRVYVVSFSASDGKGGECLGSVSVCVDKGGSCVDNGQTVNSLGPCPEPGLPASDPGIGEVGIHVLEAARHQTVLEYGLPRGTDVRLAVYDVAGRLVANLENRYRNAGTHRVSWNTGSLASGLYFARLKADGVTINRTIVVK